MLHAPQKITPARARLRRAAAAPLFRRLLALSLLLVCCSCGSRRASLFEVVPGRSVIAVSINWTAVRGDSELRKLLKADEAERVFRELGVSPSDVADVAVFGDAVSGADDGSGSTGIVVRGRFTPRVVVDLLKARGWAANTYGGRELLSDAARRQWCAPLKSNIFVCGSRAGVEGAMDAAQDSSDSFARNPSCAQMSARLRKSKAPIVMMAAFPQEMQDMADAAVFLSSKALDLAGLEGLGGLMRSLGLVRGFGCAIAHSGDGLPVEMVALMEDEKTAGLVSGAFNAMKRLTQGVPRGNLSPADAEQLRRVQDIAVTREGAVLSVKAVIPLSDLRRGS
jgi:hypothetical protein